MGKAGRIACIFTPYALTIGALVSLIFVGLGCTNSDSGTLNNIFYFRVCRVLDFFLFYFCFRANNTPGRPE